MNGFHPARAAVALGGVALILLALLGRVWWLETKGAARIAERVERQQHVNERLIARRGSIFDSTGQLLAGSVQVEAIFVDPKVIVDAFDGKAGGATLMEKKLGELARALDLDPFELLQTVGDKYPARYLEIAKGCDAETIAAVRKLDLPGVGSTFSNQRVYPMGSLAAHILGGVGFDGAGLDGVELTCEKVLAGTDGSKRTLKDARRRAIGTEDDDYRPAKHGAHLVLTIDANVQQIVEQELSAAVDRFGAKSGECVVLDPADGSIVALANYPTFTPQFLNESKPTQRTNRALVYPYEPGSTIKPFIVSRAIDQKVATLSDPFRLGGERWKTPYGRTITDVHGYDDLPLWDVLVKSSNIGMSMLVEKMGNAQLHAGLSSFGFGKKTDIDLPGEGNGILRPMRKWSRASPESLAQGYEILVTPLQMARAMCSLANGGRLVTPRVVRGTLDEDGANVADVAGRARVPMFASVLRDRTSDDVRRVLADIPVRGTATKARSDVYNLFGKTGTAHRAVGGRYDTTHYTSSFVGGAPYEAPRLVIAFVIHDPQKSKGHYGGIVAAPAAGRILERSLQYLNVPPSPPLALPPPQIAALLHEFNAKLYEKKPAVAKVE